MMGGREVVLLDTLESSFGMRVRMALALKGIKYEYREENLLSKSPLLLQMSPVHKMIPVLIVDGKPISESVIILQYIDEAYHQNYPALLPSDPYQRSQARFWTDFMDNKVYGSGKRIVMGKESEEREGAGKEMIQCLKLLEQQLGDELYFGGKALGVLDITFLPYSSWFYAYQTLGHFNVEAECPKLIDWFKRCKLNDTVSNSLVHPLKVHDYVLQLRKRAALDPH